MKKLLYYIGLVFLLNINNVVANVSPEPGPDRVLLDAPLDDPNYIERLTLKELWETWQTARIMAKKHALIKPIIAKVQTIDQAIILQDTEGADNKFHTNELSNYEYLKRDILFSVLQHMLSLDHKNRPDYDSAEETLAELATSYMAMDNKHDEAKLLKKIQIIFVKMQAVQDAIIDGISYKAEYDKDGMALATGAKSYPTIKTAILPPLVQDTWSLLNTKQLLTIAKSIDSKQKLKEWTGNVIKVISHNDTITAIIFVGGKCKDKYLEATYKDLCRHLYKLAIDMDSTDPAQRAETLREIKDYYTNMSDSNAEINTMIEQIEKIYSDADIKNSAAKRLDNIEETKDVANNPTVLEEIKRAAVIFIASGVITLVILYFTSGANDGQGLVMIQPRMNIEPDFLTH